MIAVSEFVKNTLVESGCRSESIQVIHNGVTQPIVATDGLQRASFGIADDDFVFLQLGRITEWKGHLVALRAFEELCAESRDNVHFIIAGRPFYAIDSVYDQQLRVAIGESPWISQIHLLDHTSQVGNLYEMSNVVLLPSIAPDPFPTVVLEAAVSGRPSNCQLSRRGERGDYSW